MKKLVLIAILSTVTCLAVILPAGQALAENNRAEALIKEGDILFKKKDYLNAAERYEQARVAYIGLVESYEEASLERSARLEDLKDMMAQQKEKKNKQAVRKIKSEYVRVLRERKELDIVTRRAEIRAGVAESKSSKAMRWEGVREEKTRYKANRRLKKERAAAEKQAIKEAKKRVADEKKLAKEIARAQAAEKKAKKIVEKKEPEKKVKKAVSKRVAREVLKKEAKKVAKDFIAARSGVDESLDSIASSKKEAREKKADKKLVKTKAKEAKERLKKEALRGRIERIEEAKHKKREAQKSKKKEAYRKDALKKAIRSKKELGRYAVGDNIDQRRLKKAKGLVERSDAYFEKGMFKEAGELYDRASLTLRGKLY